MLGAYKGGPENCALAAPCDGIGEDAATQPVWRSFYRKRPGTPEHIEGGFALFRLGEASETFRFYESNGAPLKGGQLY